MKELNRTIEYVILLTLLLFTLISIVHADTNVSGNITTDTTWTLANSPYIVTGTVQVVEGATLTIDPGVTVKFNKDTFLRIGGELIAEGTETQMITFTANEPAPEAGDWGIVIVDVLRRLFERRSEIVDYVRNLWETPQGKFIICVSIWALLLLICFIFWIGIKWSNKYTNKTYQPYKDM